MRDPVENRILGALRFVDAVTLSPVPMSLQVSSEEMRFVRNLSGLTVITAAAGLEKYVETFDFKNLAPADIVAEVSQTYSGTVEDPSGQYLPRAFTIQLPLDPSPDLLPPDNTRPANSLFTPIDLQLLPSPLARMSPGWAQVRVATTDAEGHPLPNVLIRIVATSDDTVLGRGMSDARGEALVPVPALKLFAPGATPVEVVTSETEARLEVVLPPDGVTFVDWTEMDASPADPANVDPSLLKLKAGRSYSRTFPFTI